jgi:hypothetical protein
MPNGKARVGGVRPHDDTSCIDRGLLEYIASRSRVCPAVSAHPGTRASRPRPVRLRAPAPGSWSCGLASRSAENFNVPARSRSGKFRRKVQKVIYFVMVRISLVVSSRNRIAIPRGDHERHAELGPDTRTVNNLRIDVCSLVVTEV